MYPMIAKRITIAVHVNWVLVLFFICYTLRDLLLLVNHLYHLRILVRLELRLGRLHLSDSLVEVRGGLVDWSGGRSLLDIITHTWLHLLHLLLVFLLELLHNLGRGHFTIVKDFYSDKDMKPIKIFEKFLNDNELETVLNIIKDVNWKYTNMTRPNTPRFWIADLYEEPFFRDIIFKKIQEKTGKSFELNRVYANGQTFAQDGSYHTDHTDEGMYTFILYTSAINTDNIDVVNGYTQFKINNKVINVEPYLNRGVLFKSNILHRGLAPSRHTDFLRVSVAFKLKEME